MAETDWHRKLMGNSIEMLDARYEADEDVYVSGNLLIFYVKGNKRRHVAPDTFVVFGVPKYERPNYLIWEEGRSPDVAFEFTSSSTHKEDIKKKFLLYQDVLKVREYFLFDPFGDYLDPPLRGFRLVNGIYKPIRLLKGRLPSRVLGLHLERDGKNLRLYDPTTDAWLLTNGERIERAEAESQRKDFEIERKDLELRRKDAENERLRLELEQLRQRLR